MSLNRLSGKLKNPGTTSDDSPVFDSADEAILQANLNRKRTSLTMSLHQASSAFEVADGVLAMICY